MEPTNTPSKSTSHRLKKSIYNGGREELDRKVGLHLEACMVMIKEQDSEVDVVHRRFTEEGHSILGTFFLRAFANEVTT